MLLFYEHSKGNSSKEGLNRAAIASSDGSSVYTNFILFFSPTTVDMRRVGHIVWLVWRD